MEQILNYFKDINFMYNDCSVHDTLSQMLKDFEAEVRSKTVDEFVAKSEEYYFKVDDSVFRPYLQSVNLISEANIKFIAERMKEEQ